MTGFRVYFFSARYSAALTVSPHRTATWRGRSSSPAEDDEGYFMVINAEDPRAARATTQTMLRAALDGTDIDPASVRASAEAG